MSLPGAITVSHMPWSHRCPVPDASPAWCVTKACRMAAALAPVDRRSKCEEQTAAFADKSAFACSHLEIRMREGRVRLQAQQAHED